MRRDIKSDRYRLKDRNNGHRHCWQTSLSRPDTDADSWQTAVTVNARSSLQVYSALYIYQLVTKRSNCFFGENRHPPPPLLFPQNGLKSWTICIRDFLGAINRVDGGLWTPALRQHFFTILFSFISKKCPSSQKSLNGQSNFSTPSEWPQANFSRGTWNTSLEIYINIHVCSMQNVFKIKTLLYTWWGS